MRLIDADALFDALENSCENNCPYTKRQRDVMCGSCPMGDAYIIADDLPTIDLVQCDECVYGQTCGRHIITAARGGRTFYRSVSFCSNGKRRADVPDTNVGERGELTMNDDLISRQAAIEAMREMYHAAEKWGQEAEDDTIKARAESCMASLVEMKLRVEKLPSAERRGKWIERDEDCTWECSACGELWTLIEGTPKQNGMDYCPNCGAKMEGDE